MWEVSPLSDPDPEGDLDPLDIGRRSGWGEGGQGGSCPAGDRLLVSGCDTGFWLRLESSDGRVLRGELRRPKRWGMGTNGLRVEYGYGAGLVRGLGGGGFMQ